MIIELSDDELICILATLKIYDNEYDFSTETRKNLLKRLQIIRNIMIGDEDARKEKMDTGCDQEARSTTQRARSSRREDYSGQKARHCC